MHKRNPNSECSICKAKYYRSPCNSKYRAICKICRKKENESTWHIATCPSCKKEFKYPRADNNRQGRICCSRKCSNINRRGIRYGNGNFQSKQQRRLRELVEHFNIKCCMVENCDYNKTYDVHRLIPGKLGGKYEIGNMFAICPNHHAEFHRKVCKLEKINDYTLMAIYGVVGESGKPLGLNPKVSD